jgi:hypothetical protein
VLQLAITPIKKKAREGWFLVLIKTEWYSEKNVIFIMRVT